MAFLGPACGERAAWQGGGPEFGSVRGRFDRLRLAARPAHPDLLPARAEKEHSAAPLNLIQPFQSYRRLAADFWVEV